MRPFILFSFILIICNTAIAIIPPKHGVTPPPAFFEFHNKVRDSYQSGYYAEKFEYRKELREKISMGLLTDAVLADDTVNALTLMGQYTNLAGFFSQQQMQNNLFDGPNPTGTITDYYTEVSYNQLLFTGDCKGWYDMPHTLEYYEGGNSGLGANGGPRFVLDLIQAADPSLNFADYIQYYDGQGKPHIGFVAVIHSGADAAAGAFNIWSHRWTFGVITNGQPYITNDIDPISGQAVIIDGDYAIQPERSGSNNNGGSITTIGVFTHEFGHIFGLPDLYDTDNSSEGLGNWCLMAGGTYGGNGSSSHTPVHMSAWCKVELGWATPTNITTAMDNLSVINVEQNPVIYKMWKNGLSTTQYFLVENRQKTGFDINLYDSGFLIYHVDETRQGNTNEDHYLVDLEQADGMRHLNHGQGRGDAGDPFPGSSNNLNFDMVSNPNSKDYNLANTYVSVRNIQRDGANMIADFDIGTQPFIALDSIFISETNIENGRLEAGETGTVSFKLSNLNPVNSSNTTIRFFIDAPDIQVNQNEFSSSLSGLTTQTFSINSAITVMQNFRSREINLRYEVEGENNSIVDSVYITIGIPPLLILSKADIKSLSSYYKSSLLELNNYYEEVYLTQPAFLSQRSAIIIISGKSEVDLFTQSEIDSLTNYINNGGKVFFSGQNIAEYLQSNYPDFLNSVIGITWLQNISPLVKRAYGINGDILGTQLSEIKFNGTEGANNQTRADVIQSNGVFNLSLTYNSNGTNPAGGWITNQIGGKIFFLGFGFEAINNNESTISRTQFLYTILNWFGVPTNVDDNKSLPVSDYTLFQNYPNPFNPTTKISFTLPETNIVSLKVYNILGEQISLISNQERAAGMHSVEFDARSLSSGIYFYRLEAGSFVETKKMLLIK
ncbi:MAG: M6 family metalloprotease domain-containing protein [Ignavibacteriales bacterium]|nr:MAG: M6 family metalloprotease domain-containing protein [Ignavibacteriales bacterium]